MIFFLSFLCQGEVDLWTRTATGCACNFGQETGRNKKSCACCSHPGACQCGQRVPNRCAQCGLQHQCDHSKWHPHSPVSFYCYTCLNWASYLTWFLCVSVYKTTLTLVKKTINIDQTRGEWWKAREEQDLLDFVFFFFWVLFLLLNLSYRKSFRRFSRQEMTGTSLKVASLLLFRVVTILLAVFGR